MSLTLKHFLASNFQNKQKKIKRKKNQIIKYLEKEEEEEEGRDVQKINEESVRKEIKSQSIEFGFVSIRFWGFSASVCFFLFPPIFYHSSQFLIFLYFYTQSRTNKRTIKINGMKYKN